MARRYDPELALADRFKTYLDATLSEALRMASPVVTFYDLMAQDDAHRVVVMVESCTTLPNAPQNYIAQVEVTVKSQTAQKSLKADVESHFDRANEVREALCRATAVAELNTGVGLGVSYVSPVQKYSTDVRDGWIYSAVTLSVSCHTRDAADDV
jgi:hypothetical protein